jgi:hypothetical protein
MPQSKKKSYKQFISEIKKISINIKRNKKQAKKITVSSSSNSNSPHTYHHNNDDGLSGKFYLEH